MEHEKSATEERKKKTKKDEINELKSELETLQKALKNKEEFELLNIETIQKLS